MPATREVVSKPVALPGVVPLPENRSAIIAARRVLRRLFDGKPLVTPVYLHGPAGTGKSVVVAAMLRAITAHPAGLTARVVAARELPRPKADAADDEATAALGELVSLDFLAVEDAQYLPARSAFAFADVLDRRTARRRVTLVTASAGPAQLPKLPRRLTSRLAAGLVVALTPLGRDSRRELLTRRAAELMVSLDAETVESLLTRTAGQGVRPMLGALASLVGGKTSRTGTVPPAAPLSADRADDLNFAEGSPDPAAPITLLVGKVAAAYGITVKELLGPSRRREFLLPRQVTMYLARESTGLSLPKIGVALGGRDHTTVLHAWHRIRVLLASDERLAATVAELRASLQ
jgi:chromosomal replication initiator protein